MQVMTPPGERCEGRMHRRLRQLAIGLLVIAAAPAHSALDLRNASVERLENGLTVILLEDRHFPVVSVQMLYRIGARNEVTGKTGLAHFLEHMAFRDSSNFPDTALVSRIYAVGGEWHGYTWTDQTTYFATAPKHQLDLLLRIEADRMSRLLIAKDDMDAERGAVLAEMHMYENSPTSMLIDAVNYTSFLAHPYRNNTIGWESDIENLQHRDIVEFYQQHYHPANAVIAVVGDFESKDVRTRIDKLFGSVRRRPATPLPHTIEPLQNGVRRAVLRGNAERRQFMIAYRAPSANNPDFSAFLVLQEILGTGSGVNFRQNDWGTPVDESAVLDGAADQLTTWYPPSAQDYIFLVGGYAPDGAEESDVEQDIEGRIASVLDQVVTAPVLSRAINDVLDELTFDIETTEDAAHQLAFFDGLHALDTLLELPQHVAAVTAEDVQRVARTYLAPERRTVAWYLPESRLSTAESTAPAPAKSLPVALPRPTVENDPAPAASSSVLSGGIPVIVQQSRLSSSVQLQVVLASNQFAGASTNDPVLGHSSFAYRARPQAIADVILQAHERVVTLEDEAGIDRELSLDPETRLEQEFDAIMQAGSITENPPRTPAIIVIAGDVIEDHALALLEKTFGALAFKPTSVPRSEHRAPDDVVVKIGKPVAQAQLGYIVQASGPGERISDAYRMLLYILSHDYEGRLGKRAISDHGLAYYIGSQYRSDGTNAWITLSTGVDPPKIEPLRAVLAAEFERLSSDPPTESEILEAKRHMIGRLQSAAQSNAELATQLATQWLWYGEIITVEALRQRLDAISRQDVLDIVPAFSDGATIVVSE